MMELIKNNIHMNRQKGTAVSQITLDDDFIVPDTMDDVSSVLLGSGDIQIESSKVQGDKVLIRGKLMFCVLYRRESGGLQALKGEIPFEETVNVPDLEERDYTQVSWNLEDLSTGMINSRKLNIKAVVMLEVRVESLYDAEAAVDVQTDDGQVELCRRNIDVAALAVRRKDTYRIREELSLSANKPNMETILWREMKLRGTACRSGEGSMHLDGELMIFVIYGGEGENTPVQWVEESIPFSGEVELPEASEQMIPFVSVRLLHQEIEMKPDRDGEMRELSVDAVLELDMKLYEEKNVELLSDMYSTGCELVLDTGNACFDRLLTRNTCKCRVAEKISLNRPERILQICHSAGTVKLDAAEAKEDGLHMEGVLEVGLLYLTDDDGEPVGYTTELVPFHCAAEAKGMNEESVYQLNLGLEQLTAVMLGSESVEVKAVITADLLVLQPVCEQVITGVRVEPLDMKKLQEMPGIVGYIVQPGDTLWKIAKKFHTTVDHVAEANGLAQNEVKPGERLVLVKEIAQFHGGDAVVESTPGSGSTFSVILP